MKYKELVKRLDNQSNSKRLEIIIESLTAINVKYIKQDYSTGSNLIVTLFLLNMLMEFGSMPFWSA